MNTFEEYNEDLEDILLEEEVAYTPEPVLDAVSEKEDASARHTLALQMLKHVQENLGHAIELLESGQLADASTKLAQLVMGKTQMVREKESLSGATIIEGVFDGRAMVGSDGSIHEVPQNYASKSRLVEGDILKLTIRADGDSIFKQIKPVERRRVIGSLSFDEEQNRHIVIVDDMTYHVLDASVTYHRGGPGDEVVLVVPKSGRCRFGAVDTIKKKR